MAVQGHKEDKDSVFCAIVVVCLVVIGFIVLALSLIDVRTIREALPLLAVFSIAVMICLPITACNDQSRRVAVVYRCRLCDAKHDLEIKLLDHQVKCFRDRFTELQNYCSDDLIRCDRCSGGLYKSPIVASDSTTTFCFGCDDAGHVGGTTLRDNGDNRYGCYPCNFDLCSDCFCRRRYEQLQEMRLRLEALSRNASSRNAATQVHIESETSRPPTYDEAMRNSVPAAV